jgi:hypothetical protein
MLHEDTIEQYKDLLSLEVPDWVINPFSDTEVVRAMEKN